MYFIPGKTRTYRRVFLRVQRELALADFLARQSDFFLVSDSDFSDTDKSSNEVRVFVTPVLSAMGGTISQDMGIL